MKITAIYGTGRKEKSSTYNIAKRFINNLSNGDSLDEFFLPKSMPNFCRGCWQCFTDHTKCPDYEYLKPIVESMINADLIIFTAPAYVFHVPGQVKALFDHLAYQWMPHMPRKEMFGKQALLISTAAGAGTKSTLKDMKDSMFFWGIGNVYTFGRNTQSDDWGNIDKKRWNSFEVDIDKLSTKIKRDKGNLRVPLKTKALFYAMRHVQKKYRFSEADYSHWESKGWLEKKRPWK